MSDIHQKLIHLDGILTQRPHSECAHNYEHSELNKKMDEMLGRSNYRETLKHPETFGEIIHYLSDGGLSRLVIEAVVEVDEHGEQDVGINIRPTNNFETKVMKRWEELDEEIIINICTQHILYLLFANKIDQLEEEIQEDKVLTLGATD